MSKKRLGYSLIFVETIKECGRNNEFEPTKYKRVEITNECSEYLFNNNEARMEQFNQMFCYKDRIREMLEHTNYENVNDRYQQISDLQHRLEVAERTTKLACKELADSGCNYCPYNLQGGCPNECPDNTEVLEKHFKQQAEKELKGE